MMRRYKRTVICWTIWMTLLFSVWIYILRIITEPKSLPYQINHNGNYNRYLAYRKSEHLRRGPGEFGKPVHLKREEAFKVNALMESEAFNIVASDRVSLDRALPDVRNPKCKLIRYPKELPKASVVIIFHNEAWSTLLRTVHSVINRSPPELLSEVVLVDDASYKDHLKSGLDEYISETWPDVTVRLIRIKERTGLIRAKIAGAKSAKGEVLVFLDAHCEVNAGWLEPQLERIHEDRKTVVCPRIHPIDARTLAYQPYGRLHSVGGFWWSLHFRWMPMSDKDIERHEDQGIPVRSPTMAGGIFAIERTYFFEIGAYDSGMDVWGGENLEMSFRIWMCGGQLEIHPCSVVGHIFRDKHPYTFPGNKDTHGINSARLADVWMDRYKELFYMHRTELKDADYGDLSDRHYLRRHLKCKSFKWYLDNVYPQKFVPDENVKAYGTLRHRHSGLCLDTLQGEETYIRSFGIFWCGEKTINPNQLFSLTNNDTIRHEELCLSIALPAYSKYYIHGKMCDGDNGMTWIHNKDKGTLMNLASGLCIDALNASSGSHVMANKCDDSSLTQQWSFKHYVY